MDAGCNQPGFMAAPTEPSVRASVRANESNRRSAVCGQARCGRGAALQRLGTRLRVRAISGAVARPSMRSLRSLAGRGAPFTR